jgi:iron complex outermembrane recepter protein
MVPFVLLLASAATAWAAPVAFEISASTADAALLVFSQQAKVEVLYSSEELKSVRLPGLVGRFEPEEALHRLLAGSGYVARKNLRGKFVVTRAVPPTGSIKGRVLTAEGRSAHRARVAIPELGLSTRTDENGEFHFPRVKAGTHRIVVNAHGHQPLHITEAVVGSDQVLELAPQAMVNAVDPTQLEPYIVEGQIARSGPFERSHTLLPPRTAVGNLDLPRTENDALPYTIYERDQITRSGVVTLSEFLQRELLDSTPTASAPDSSASIRQVADDSSSPRLRGYTDTDETIILVNGRRLPEALTAESGPQPPDVNFIPMSLVQQVQVLPVSAAALYSGNPVGGVINIVLRPDVDANSTEIVSTYTNALGGFDASQKTVSLLHSEALLGGALRLRVNGSYTEITPATESDLNYRRSAPQPNAPLDASVYRATPNVRSVDGSPLFGPGTSSVTSVAPKSDGTAGLAPFLQRQGLRNFDFFDTPGTLAALNFSPDSSYGRRQKRTAFFGSAVYDAFPWLQLALDLSHARTIVPRGYQVLNADLTLGASSSFNPFGKDVIVSLNETVPSLGENYTQGRLEHTALVGGLMFNLPADWRVSFDAQYSTNVSRFRGISHVDVNRWQQLVDQGRYNPLRDTQLFAPPQSFYDEVLVFRGGPGQYVTLGDYETLDAAIRVMNRSLPLPTGTGSLNVGGDYRRTHMDPITEEPRFGDGTLAGPVLRWSGRTLQRYSVFGEMQAPLYPERRLPSYLRGIHADVALRYIASDNAGEANVAPTFGLKLDFAGGLIVRGSVTTSNRLPTPHMARRQATSTGGGGGANRVTINDPVRREQYEVAEVENQTPSIIPESAVTQSAGVIYQRGKRNRFRASLDFVDTRKTDELVALNPQSVLNLEPLLPEFVEREARQPEDPKPAGRVRTVTTGVINMAWRHSQHWSLTLNYARPEILGGTVDLYTRVLYFQQYRRQVAAGDPTIDELEAPSGSSPGILRYRATLGAGWSAKNWSFGLDAYYFHARKLAATEWAAQGSDRIDAYWQAGAYLQTDLTRWLPWKPSRLGLRGQVRINNIFDADYPRYANEPTGAGVQAYGDWRGRTYSLSLTATF